MLIVIISGLAAGLIHVLTGPDHLAAVAPLSVRSSARGWLTGARWGMGHSAGVLMVGLLSLVLREVLPLERLRGIALVAPRELTAHGVALQHRVAIARIALGRLADRIVGTFEIAGALHVERLLHQRR